MTMGLQVLAESVISDDDKESVAMMREAVTYMSETLYDILNIQKVEEGILELEYESFVIDDMLKTVFESYKELITDKELKLSVQIVDDVPWAVWGDTLRVGHVFGNLLSNAIKFSPINGTINVSVSTDDGCVTFKIRDFGPGLLD